MKNIFVFDVESTSLHGKAFAVGAVVMNLQGVLIDSFSLVSAQSLININDWVKENVLPQLKDIEMCKNDFALRERFFRFYLKYKDDCEIWADCCFPVETNFLSDIVKDYPDEREFLMPYPLKDISTVIGIDVDRYKIVNTTFVKHNPLSDSMVSALCLINKLNNKL